MRGVDGDGFRAETEAVINIERGVRVGGPAVGKVHVEAAAAVGGAEKVQIQVIGD